MMGNIKSAALALGVLTAITIGLTGVMWWTGVDPASVGQGIAAVADGVAPYRWHLLTLRWACWILLWRYWARVGHQLCPGTSDKAQAFRGAWLLSRPRMLGAIALVESLILLSFWRF